MSRRTVSPWIVVALLGGLTTAQACEPLPGTTGDPETLGAEARLGDGTLSSYVQIDPAGAPTAIGLVFSPDALNALPTARSDGHRCFDLDGNGAIESDSECLATHERVIPLPPEATRRGDIPFKWILLNWNPQGHLPPHIYGLPHLDIHYVMEPIEDVFAIMPGPCGDEFIRCDHWERAVVPVPENYMHPDFQDVGAVVPAMGNHLVDLGSPEFHGSTFDRTWIYGVYEGRVTFWEEMVTRDFLLGRPNTCFDIKTPAAVAVAGYYPTRSCFRFEEGTGQQRVSIEGFVQRAASAPTAFRGESG